MLTRFLHYDRDVTVELLNLCETLPDTLIDQKVDIGHGSLRGIFGHLVRNVETWTALMRGRPVVPRYPETPNMSELLSRFIAAQTDFAELALATQAAGLINDTWADVLDHPPQQKTFGGAIGHVLTHNVHHRAGVMHVFRSLGVTGVPEADMMYWDRKRCK